MDLWVVAAAAGAGYLAKHWQNIFREKEGALGFSVGSSFLDEPQSPSLIEILRERTNPLKELARTGSDIGKGDQSGELFVETSRRGREATCSSDMNHGQEVGVHDDGSANSEYVFSSGFGNDKNFEWNRGDFVLDADMSNIPEDSTWKMGGSLASRRSRNTKRSRRLHLPFIKPRTSLDSCLMAQMHNRERNELEEYLLTPLSSPRTPALRPFLVSDGKRLISKTRGLYKEVYPISNNEVIGVPRLPQTNTVDYSKEKFSIKNQMDRLLFRSKLMQVDTRAGISSGQALFCLGISMGILSTIIANKVELEKLKESLKQSEHLVEDLQDELEMKDSLTVKELVNDDDSQDIHGILTGTEILDMNVLVQFADEESVCLKKDDSISNIEAELEAELERLELSMKGSTLPGELNHEFDEDMIADLVSGELQADAVRRRSSSESTLGRSSHSSPTPHSTKDGVSPRELSLRLHEVIQSRLEKRVMELEAELATSQNHIERLISERANYWRDVPDSGRTSSRCSPRVIETRGPRGPSPRPLIMNLSGDALDAYNEAFEELDKLKQTEDRETPLQSDGLTGFSEGSKAWLAGKQEEAVPISITGIPSSEDSPNDNYDSDEDDDDDMLLIKQIVEKARQGSPAIMRAQKAMVYLNRDH
ncbi:uncharacterized protein LOC141652750 [Silene latifolia]|uniref:uncharacterized protein LOC141652750 n=1 Tax=Silene latifolia TaxID=37657 RepID=UPI003D7864F8